MRVDRPIDILRLVKAGSVVSGCWPLSEMRRLSELLAREAGEAAYQFSFGVDRWNNRYVDVSVKAELSLICQRSVVAFEHPVDQQQRLGLIDHDEDEAALPKGYEPYVLPADPVRLIDLIEDELILAIPLVPVAPGSRLEQIENLDNGDENSAEKPNPFGVLAVLKTNEEE